MLTEHKEALIKLEKEEWEVELHGELDEEQWWEISEIIMDPEKHTLPIKIKYWKEEYYFEQEC
ncbi:YolD-like family protein [Shouchella patagoniensis]|uniref:YolD-like family protein n=1 Tax=Shouchella patagoniensis TaxID=228576 RepID=UPI0014751D80|nr:YolD-like family protein [Shouchella patagoniensis]